MLSQRKLRLILLAALFAFAWASSSDTMHSYSANAAEVEGNAKSKTPRRPSIMVIGDSTTQYGGGAQGWEVLLHEAYVRSADTINRGLSGYNTRTFIKYAMPGIVDELTYHLSPTVIIVWFGVNDATLENGPNRSQHISLDDYRQNLITIITKLRAYAPDAKILLLSPGYIGEQQRRDALGRHNGEPLDRNNEETAKYAAVCGEVAKALDREDISYFDVYSYFDKTYPSDAQRASMLGDGLHFSTDGNRVFYELIKRKIEDMVPRAVLTTRQYPFDIEIDRMEGK